MKDYIGDGVYVEFDGFGLKLRANSPDSPHVVYLEPQVLEALNHFAKWCAAKQGVQLTGLTCPACGGKFVKVNSCPQCGLTEAPSN